MLPVHEDSTGAARTKTIIALAVISVLAFALRMIHSGDALGGYLVFNEAWYATIATNYSDVTSLFFPSTPNGAIDYNVSPFLSHLLYLSILMFGLKESVMSVVPTLFSALTCPVIFALGARFFDRRSGLAAAALYAFVPVSVITGQNIQTDAVYIFFMTFSFLLYLKADDGEKRNIGLMALAGLLFGVAFLTKQFTGILLPVIVIWETVRNRGLRWLGRGHIVFGLAALVAPGPFIGYHLLHNLDVLLAAQSRLSAGQFVTVSSDVFSYVLPEYIWGLSPPVFILAAAGLLYTLVKKFNSGFLLLLAVAGFNWFYYHWHWHSYYTLFATPFLCLAAGGLIGNIRWRTAGATLAAAVCVFAAALSISMLCTVKYGYGEFRGVAKIMDKVQGRPVLVLMDSVAGSYYPAARYYNRSLDILTEEELADMGMDAVTFRPDRGIFILGYGRVDGKRLPRHDKWPVAREAYGLLLFGYQLVAEMESENFFSVSRLYFLRNGKATDFGVKKLGAYQSMTLAYVNPQEGIPIVDGMIDFSKRNAGEISGGIQGKE